ELRACHPGRSARPPAPRSPAVRPVSRAAPARRLPPRARHRKSPPAHPGREKIASKRCLRCQDRSGARSPDLPLQGGTFRGPQPPNPPPARRSDGGSRLRQTCAEYLAKGRQVALVGKLRLNEWTNPDGERRSRLQAVADTVR